MHFYALDGDNKDFACSVENWGLFEDCSFMVTRHWVANDLKMECVGVVYKFGILSIIWWTLKIENRTENNIKVTVKTNRNGSRSI